MLCNKLYKPEIEPDLSVTGEVFDFQRFSTNDGHGIRSMVFLKGCPLRCEWCANPESQKKEPQMGFYAEKCIGCSACAEVCPHGDVFINEGRIAWESCEQCFSCVDACLYNARTSFGRKMTVEQVLKELLADRIFFDSSGGGITISGGEAAYQPGFALNILAACRKENVHTAIETCGFASKGNFRKIAEQTDLLLYDIKHMNSGIHELKTGVPNKLILENAVAASEIVPEMIIRFPLIPGFNNDYENIIEMGAFIRDKLPRVRQLDVMPYHTMGESKITVIGGDYKYPDGREILEEEEENVRKILESFGLEVTIGG